MHLLTLSLLFNVFQFEQYIIFKLYHDDIQITWMTCLDWCELLPHKQWLLNWLFSNDLTFFLSSMGLFSGNERQDKSSLLTQANSLKSEEIIWRVREEWKKCEKYAFTLAATSLGDALSPRKITLIGKVTLTTTSHILT